MEIIKKHMNKQTKDVNIFKLKKETKTPFLVNKKGKSQIQENFWQKNGGLDKNEGPWTNRVLVATPTTGLIRYEWAAARFGQLIPTNFSMVNLIQWISPYSPLNYTLPDAENLIARAVIEGDYQWLIFIENDNVLPLDFLIRMNEYMDKGDIPVVSGLYFTKSNPPEPLVYRGRGTGSFQDFKLGERVWCDGLPFGAVLIHASIIRALWNESPEYSVNGQITRRVFDNTPKQFGKPEDGKYATTSGTTDLAFYTRIMENDIFRKAGWPEYSKKKYPFLVDTNIFVQHITQSGIKYPLFMPQKYIPLPKKLKKGERLNLKTA